jgi:hypothetical protein
MNKNLEKFSLLYPAPEIYEQDKSNVCFQKNFELLTSLGLGNILGADKDKRDILKYVTGDVETINYRADIFADILKNRKLHDVLSRAHEYLIDIYDVIIRSRNLHKEGALTDSFFVINEIELYIKLIDYL